MPPELFPVVPPELSPAVAFELSPRARLVLAALLTAVLVALAGCSYSPPPSVCAVCDERLTTAAAERGVDVSVTHSELHIHLREDGSARWEARVRLGGEGVDELRSNVSLRDDVVQSRLANDSGPAPDEHRDRSIAMDGDTLVVGFDDPNLATHHAGGVLAVDRFHHQGVSTVSPFRLRADRMVLHPPDGWAVVNRPRGASVESNAVVWDNGIDSRTYVVVGPDRSRRTAVLAQVAVGAEVASWAAGPWLQASLLSVLGLGAVAHLLLGRVDHEPPRTNDVAVNGELVGAVSVAVLVLVAAGVVVAAFHFQFSGGTAAGLATVFGPTALLFMGTGMVAHRRPAVRWPPAVVAVGTAPLVCLGLVLYNGPSAPLVTAVMLIWTVAAAIVGALAFRIGREVTVGRDRPPVEG